MPLTYSFCLLFQKKEDNHVKTVQPTSQFVYKVRLIKYDETKKVPIIKRVKEVVETINLVQVGFVIY